MKRNGMCPICFVKQLFMRPKAVSNLYDSAKYDNGVALTPPMGWSSWNTFRNTIDEDLIYDTAVAMKEKGLADAGYTYVNLDDCWHSNQRDADGKLQGDLTAFHSGIPALVKKINNLGLKVGIYSSNGLLTCEDLPASQRREEVDALTFARWGIEYFKYDFCHNVPLSKYAPLVYGISLSKDGKGGEIIQCSKAKLSGLARFMSDKHVTGCKYVSGLDRNVGAVTFKVNAEEDGEHVLTVHIRKKGRYFKTLVAEINGEVCDYIEFPPQKHFNYTAKFQVKVNLNRGENTIKLFNPVSNRADSAMLQYRYMGKMLKEGVVQAAKEEGREVKPIVFSICEWGRNHPAKWGAKAGNLWRTTPDIRPWWWWMIGCQYGVTVKLYKSATIGGWNDPDMLEVGNGKLTYDENVSHFSLWCMMSSPLILGNDLRTMPTNVLDIVTNRNLISIDQDALGKQAKRLIKGRVDVLAKPLADGGVALCIFNKSGREIKYSYSLKGLASDGYIGLKNCSQYTAIDQWLDTEETVDGIINTTVSRHGVKVYKIYAK